MVAAALEELSAGALNCWPEERTGEEGCDEDCGDDWVAGSDAGVESRGVRGCDESVGVEAKGAATGDETDCDGTTCDGTANKERLAACETTADKPDWLGVEGAIS